MKAMKKSLLFNMAALVTMGAILIGCSKEDNLQLQEEKNIVKLSVTVGFNETKGTKALDVDLVNKTAAKTFAPGDCIAVFYKKGADTKIAYSEPLTSGGTSATFTISLDTPSDNSDIRIVYPSAMANGEIATDAEINDANTIDFSKLDNQNGTLASLGSNLDLCTFDGNLSGTALPTTALLINRLAICAFTLMDNNGTTDSKTDDVDITGTITGMTISDGTNNYVVTRSPSAGPIYVAMRPITTATSLVLTATDGDKHYTKVTSSRTYAANTFYQFTSRVISLTGFDLKDGSFNQNKDAYIYQTDAATETTANTITIAEGKTVIIDGVNIVAGDANAISCSGSATIVVSGTNIVKNASGGTYGRAIIKAGPSGTELRFIGGGKLTASSNYTSAHEGAIIGSDKNTNCGNIVIEGCEIEANGPSGQELQGAAIGAGKAQSGNSECGNISIVGAKVTVNSTSGAGIGSGGCYTNGKHSHCGNIEIQDSEVTATALAGAAIGSGYASNGATQCGTILISGSSSSVEATSKKSGAAIGSGSTYGSTGQSVVGIITIEGGTVTAICDYTSNNGGAGIGSGVKATCSGIVINGGSVTSTGGKFAAGIGSTYRGTCTSIEISGGNVDATGGPGAAAIGAGCASGSYTSTCGSITISSSVTQVKATKGTEAQHSIGLGKEKCSCGTVTIGGTVYWDGSEYKNGGADYLTTSPLVYTP